MRTFPKARVIVSAALFLGWLGFLALLVINTRDPIIVSRPQVTVSSAVLQVEVKDQNSRPHAQVKLTAVHRAAEDFADLKPGVELVIADLVFIGPKQGYRGAGSYLVPVLRRQQSEQVLYEVTPLPLSPGFFPRLNTIELENPGPQADQLRDLIARVFPERAAAAKDLIDKAVAAPQVLAKNVEDEAADKFQHDAQALGARLRTLKDGSLPRQETRVYKTTEDALRQLSSIPK
jgi:hypothetical protein